MVFYSLQQPTHRRIFWTYFSLSVLILLCLILGIWAIMEVVLGGLFWLGAGVPPTGAGS